MAAPVVWFEIAGRDLDALTRFYGDLLGWKVETELGQAGPPDRASPIGESCSLAPRPACLP
jgi:predicted enzyme related to lactoylglutathione lyase